MTWPPMAAREVIVSEIVGTDAEGPGMGAGAQLNRKNYLDFLYDEIRVLIYKRINLQFIP